MNDNILVRIDEYLKRIQEDEAIADTNTSESTAPEATTPATNTEDIKVALTSIFSQAKWDQSVGKARDYDAEAQKRAVKQAGGTLTDGTSVDLEYLSRAPYNEFINNLTSITYKSQYYIFTFTTPVITQIVTYHTDPVDPKKFTYELKDNKESSYTSIQRQLAHSLLNIIQDPIVKNLQGNGVRNIYEITCSGGYVTAIKGTTANSPSEDIKGAQNLPLSVFQTPPEKTPTTVNGAIADVLNDQAALSIRGLAKAISRIDANGNITLVEKKEVKSAILKFKEAEEEQATPSNYVNTSNNEMALKDLVKDGNLNSIFNSNIQKYLTDQKYTVSSIEVEDGTPYMKTGDGKSFKLSDVKAAATPEAAPIADQFGGLNVLSKQDLIRAAGALREKLQKYLITNIEHLAALLGTEKGNIDLQVITGGAKASAEKVTSSKMNNSKDPFTVLVNGITKLLEDEKKETSKDKTKITENTSQEIQMRVICALKNPELKTPLTKGEELKQKIDTKVQDLKKKADETLDLGVSASMKDSLSLIDRANKFLESEEINEEEKKEPPKEEAEQEKEVSDSDKDPSEKEKELLKALKGKKPEELSDDEKKRLEELSKKYPEEEKEAAEASEENPQDQQVAEVQTQRISTFTSLRDGFVNAVKNNVLTTWMDENIKMGIAGGAARVSIIIGPGQDKNVIVKDIGNGGIEGDITFTLSKEAKTSVLSNVVNTLGVIGKNLPNTVGQPGKA